MLNRNGNGTREIDGDRESRGSYVYAFRHFQKGESDVIGFQKANLLSCGEFDASSVQRFAGGLYLGHRGLNPL
jgi:hypothetical protein